MIQNKIFVLLLSSFYVKMIYIGIFFENVYKNHINCFLINFVD